MLADEPSFRHYEIPIRSRCVLRVFVQSGCHLQLAEEGAEAAIQIADPLAVVTENDPLLNLQDADVQSFGKVIVCGHDLRVSRRLQIVLNPDIWFRVEPQPPASGTWGPAGSKGLILVCMPGSEIALWFGRYRRAADLQWLESYVAG
jgi:hypothetical protein